MTPDMRTLINLIETSSRQDVTPMVEDVWHGSPHQFKKFSVHKINTGEQNQAFGWGLYFADAREVAEYYRRNLSRYTYDGKPVRKNQERLRSAVYQLVQAHGNKEEAKQCDRSVADLIDQLDYEKIGILGKMYHVEIPDEGTYLLWDKPFKEQPLKVKRALKALASRYGSHILDVIKDNDVGEVIYRHMSNFNRNVHRLPWGDEYKQSSLDLLSVGIHGIKYLDGFSRVEGGESANYVLFDDGLARIKAVY